MTTYTSVLAAPAFDSRFESALRNVLPFLDADVALTPEVGLRDLGLDSMGMVELLAELESGYDVRFRDEALTMATFSTPGVLWGVLSSMLVVLV
ncbi:acyl carrier protein [Kibdelosporangium banguiense]|uniref:Acyl carrier protein n=1 Tax=Kibdelosporangium banguiense TaxID=1365924 RepID=A0ABS4TP21_9PSEU|nr:acyl carrier protein [Kibdelosporangium banguiense]MBP2326158.1 acyl carrier protein [Kibdelosporangium banguiense]